MDDAAGPVPGPNEPGGSTDRPPVAPVTPSVPVAQQRVRGAEAAKLHLTLVLVLALCAVAFRFEIGRALGGNSLSWAYVFEWPMFAVFGLYMWWTLLHGGRPGRAADDAKGSRSTRTAKALDPKYAGMLEAWEAHQRELQAAQAEAEGREVPGPQTGSA